MSELTALNALQELEDVVENLRGHAAVVESLAELRYSATVASHGREEAAAELRAESQAISDTMVDVDRLARTYWSLMERVREKNHRPAGNLHPDAEILAAWDDHVKARSVEIEAIGRGQDAECITANDARWAVTDKIVASQAKTLEGLAVQAGILEFLVKMDADAAPTLLANIRAGLDAMGATVPTVQPEPEIMAPAA